MAHLHPAPSVARKQRTERPNGQRASVLKAAASGARKTRNRPFGTVPTRIARVEKWIELLCALDDCASLERRSGKVLAYSAKTLDTLQAQFTRGEISKPFFIRHLTAIDAVEYKIGLRLLEHANHLYARSIPECKNLAAQADRDAA